MSPAMGHLAGARAAGPGRLMRPAKPLGNALALAVCLAAFVAVNAFWRHLGTGSWANFRPSAYYLDLTTPLADIFRHPLDVLGYPWMILITGLLLGLVILVPVLTAVLYRSIQSLAFLLVLAFVGHAPVLALAVAVGCILAGRGRLPSETPWLACVLGLLPAGAYLALSALAGVDTAAVLPLQRWALYAPFLIAILSAVLAAAVILIAARLGNYRPLPVCLLLVCLLALPAAAFRSRVGGDELDYALIVNRSKAEQISPGEAVFHDRALEPWAREHGGEGLNPQTTRLRVEEDLAARRDRLVAQCREFLAGHPRSDRRPAVMWLLAQAGSLQLDDAALAAGLIRYSAAFPLPASAAAWQQLRQAYPASPQASLADWRLGELSLRAVAHPGRADPNQFLRKADEHLHRSAEALGRFLPATADRAEGGESTRMFAATVDMPTKDYYRQALEAVQRICWLMDRNDVLSDPDSAEALAAFLDLNPKQPDYYAQLVSLLNDPARKRERTSLGDNLKLAIALQTPDVYERAEMLIQLARDERTDAAIVANFELGKLALRTAEAPAIGLVEGLKTPEEYFRIVMAAPPNPYQQKAAEMLASLANSSSSVGIRPPRRGTK